MSLFVKFLMSLSLLFSTQSVTSAIPVHHPHNAAGFVTDGSPQDDDAHCVGPNPGRFACLVARHPGLIAFLRSQWEATHPVVTAAFVSTIPRNAIEACIIQNESRGSYYPNPPGDGGQRYQFLYSTWIAHGGNPNTYGHASPAEQDQVFINTVRDDPGYTDWRAYDGC